MSKKQESKKTGIKTTYDVILKHDDGCSTNNPQGFLTGTGFVYFDL